MSSTFESYTIKQLDEAESNLLKQVERIRKERKSRNSENKKEFSLSSLFSMKSTSEEKPKKKNVEKKSAEKSTPKKSNDDDDSRPIKATVASMKEVLNYHHVDFPSNAKKDELSVIVRKHNLVRECEKKEANKKA
jgi:hypothetical protein